MVEYDLDNEDEDWLERYNVGRSKLSDEKFECMLWKLELACAEATEAALTAAGMHVVLLLWLLNAGELAMLIQPALSKYIGARLGFY